MPSLYTILNTFRELSTSPRDLGNRFERFVAAYLTTDPQYQPLFSHVWLWNEWPDRKGVDVGIDLVAKERTTGAYWAIQCKCYHPDHTLDKKDIDSFFTASGKRFVTQDGEHFFTHRLIVSTTDQWSKHAKEALQDQHIPTTRIGMTELAKSPIDWSTFHPDHPQHITLQPKKTIRPHQQKALDAVLTGMKNADRGKLIMACGTGKTFTALKIAEHATSSQHGLVLFLVPSISLLSQTLREWTTETTVPFYSLAICSDKKVGKRNIGREDMTVQDLAFPATTDPHALLQAFRTSMGQRVVLFSTYHSIHVIAESQQHGLPDIDLIICDEAHRTTGVILSDEDESYFTKVHDPDYIRAKKRVYMTATPRIFKDEAKNQARENDLILCSMDDESLYGETWHRLGFSEAVRQNLLSDYKVMVLAVDERYISHAFQKELADVHSEITLEDRLKIVGCWNGLSKRRMTKGEEDTRPMQRAVAFSGSIKASEKVTRLFSKIIQECREKHPGASFLSCEVDHVDGTHDIVERNKKLDWLKADPPENTCRILSNARCLSEGVDVPALDAVLFLNPRHSIVDVVQSVGRVMRKAEGKQYGYVILPVGVPSHLSPEEALKDNKKYKVVWQVLQALRAHDDRFNATVNKIELNTQRPDRIQVIGVSDTEDVPHHVVKTACQSQFLFPHLEEWRDAIYAKIVGKCGDRRYWESWAKDIATLADTHIAHLNALLVNPQDHVRVAFDHFLSGLQSHLNPSISPSDAVEMLAQHLITQPVFDALFEGYTFTEHNPVSQAMQKMLEVLHNRSFETKTLEKFYESVRERAKGIDNAAGKQKIIIELYEQFFKTAFPRMAERLGIVYTPVEVVDFIIQSAEAALREEFGVGLTDEGVHILDPFTGTGTFIVRLLQSGVIKKEDIVRKYSEELHANELILLAYYIAAINIEETYHEISKKEYKPFPGIVLADTFQLTEEKHELEKWLAVENGERAKRQRACGIQVILGNPPYSAGQTSENDNNKNVKYPILDQRIRETYAQESTAVNKNSVYDAYIRGIRWASDRIKGKGVVCYVTNGSFIDSNAMDGLRSCLVKEFSKIYCFNLRGNQRTSGEMSRMEGGKIFGSGSRTPIAITLLIRNPIRQGKECELFYYDIGDYLSREEKLKNISGFKNIHGILWTKIAPNKDHDWIHQRNVEFEEFIAIGNKDKENTEKTIFYNYSGGIGTSRDSWAYNFSKCNLNGNIQRMIDFYNVQIEVSHTGKEVSNDSTKISWSSSLKNFLERGLKISYREDACVHSMYRPYQKQWLYFDGRLNHRVGQFPKIFPHDAHVENVVICVTGIGVVKEFSAIISNVLPDLCIQGAATAGQCFPLYTYERNETEGGSLFDTPETRCQKKENITDAILYDFKNYYCDPILTKEDIFYYVYGVLHSPEYKNRFANDLKKMLPRIPFAKDFWAFSQAGRELAHWHLNYETVEPYPVQETVPLLTTDEMYCVHRMVFGKKGKESDKSTIVYNSHITLSGIPLEAYEYKVCDKSALEWIMERYAVTVDKDSGIRNDANDWSENPRYIVDLIKRIVRVSMETVKIVKGLPALG